MAGPLAPQRSLVPQTRPDVLTPEQRRAQAMRMAEDFAALEARADMDPYLRDDALRRLGYRSLGGLRGVDFAPGRSSGYPSTAALYYPSRQPEERGITLGGIFFSDPVMAHESGHAGVDFVYDALDKDPSLLEIFREEGLNVSQRPQLGYDFEEALVELGDNPSDTWNLPSNRQDWLFPEATKTIGSTIEFLPEEGTDDRDRVERMNAAMQRVAEDELRRQGEPPRAEMREPGPESMFYREPEREGGIGGLFRRLFGG